MIDLTDEQFNELLAIGAAHGFIFLTKKKLADLRIKYNKPENLIHIQDYIKKSMDLLFEILTHATILNSLLKSLTNINFSYKNQLMQTTENMLVTIKEDIEKMNTLFVESLVMHYALSDKI